MNILTRCLPANAQRVYPSVLFVLLFLLLPRLAVADGATFYPGPEHGISFQQADFIGIDPPVANTSVGLLRVNLIQLRAASGMGSGFINVAVNPGLGSDRWIVRNMAILPEFRYPYAELATQFDLNTSVGFNITGVTVTVYFSEQPLSEPPPPLPQLFSVGDFDLAIGGVPDADNGQTGAGAPTPPNLELFDFGGENGAWNVGQPDHPNRNAAVNQSYPMAFANSLQYLENTSVLDVPDDHVPGLIGDGSLVGELADWMARSVVDRLNGEGVERTPGLEGKLSYLADNGLDSLVRTRHWGRWIQNSDITATVGGRTARSSWMGQTWTQQAMEKALADGDDCEAIYHWQGGNIDGFNYPAGGHAVELVAAGTTLGTGWIIEASDLNQRDDSAGALGSGFLFWNLADPDDDDYFNLHGSSELELDTLICEKVVLFEEEQQGELKVPAPDDLTAYNFLLMPLLILQINDFLNHLCCLLGVDLPPGALDFSLQRLPNGNLRFIITGPSVWLPITVDVAADGSFVATSVSPIAGFNGITTRIEGQFGSKDLEMVISIGANGGLPGNGPIDFITRLLAPGGFWPWIDVARIPIAPDKPRASVRINGQTGVAIVSPGLPFALSLGLHAAGKTTNMEYYMLALVNGKWYHYNAITKGFTEGINPVGTGELTDVANLPLFVSLLGLPQFGGPVQFMFLADPVIDGVPSIDAEGAIFSQTTLFQRSPF